MPITVNAQTSITMLDPEFITILNKHLNDTSLNASAVVALNFRDICYTRDSCSGFHPVEIHVDNSGNLLCLTDFAYFGVPPMVELGIELDWDFEHDSFRQFDIMYDLECGRSLLGLYTRNFTAYYKSGVYEVEITAL